MNFTSDNTSGMAPEILAALTRVNDGDVPSYGADRWSGALDDAFGALFETPVRVFTVTTGTAANALALAQLTPPWGAVFCHEGAHINADECGAPEFFNPGAKLIPVAGHDGKMTPATLEAVLALFEPGSISQVQPAALSLSQASEAGTIYTPSEIAALTAIARAHGLKVHMDGARFANALVTLGATPADVTWRAGIDVLSFGATKNGAMMAEAVVFFRPELAEAFSFRRKRAGQILSKARFPAAQLLAYIEDRLWLRLAAHANQMAQRLAAGLAKAGVAPVHPVEANEVFVRLTKPRAEALRKAGVSFYDWPAPGIGPNVYRLVTSFTTTPESVDALLSLMKTQP